LGVTASGSSARVASTAQPSSPAGTHQSASQPARHSTAATVAIGGIRLAKPPATDCRAPSHDSDWRPSPMGAPSHLQVVCQPNASNATVAAVNAVRGWLAL